MKSKAQTLASSLCDLYDQTVQGSLDLGNTVKNRLILWALDKHILTLVKIRNKIYDRSPLQDDEKTLLANSLLTIHTNVIENSGDYIL